MLRWSQFIRLGAGDPTAVLTKAEGTSLLLVRHHVNRVYGTAETR